MPTFKLTQTIDAPVAEAFRVVSDLTTFPEWNPTTKTVEKLSDGEPANGTMYRMAIRGFGKSKMELQEFDLNRQVRLVPQLAEMIA